MVSACAHRAGTGLVGLAAVALAVACCAGGPLLTALFGALALGVLVDIGAALLLLFTVGGGRYLRHRGARRLGRPW